MDFIAEIVLGHVDKLINEVAIKILGDSIYQQPLEMLLAKQMQYQLL
jgi:hypothetical protein